MILQETPLRYSIDDWHKLPEVLSNNSRDLKITVTDIIDGDALTCLRIAVEHCKYGTLFAETINAKGYLITNFQQELAYTLTDDNIFNELAKYGFFVSWNKEPKLSTEQVEYLRTLDALHYDKLRLLNVRKTVNSETTSEVYIVVFQANELPQWMDNRFATTEAEFAKALIKGYAMNLSTISHNRDYRWDWLDFVADIKLLIEANSPEESLGGE